ncbi:hypothetical protein ABZ953_29160 [Streptomyces sp. NPDC046465]|uniref:hypothetical protein n=1 Tax=Streptomyces sp. NPDC046465 TaxID=3155810 RepID=UPI0033E99FAF
MTVEPASVGPAAAQVQPVERVRRLDEPLGLVLLPCLDHQVGRLALDEVRQALALPEGPQGRRDPALAALGKTHALDQVLDAVGVVREAVAARLGNAPAEEIESPLPGLVHDAGAAGDERLLGRLERGEDVAALAEQSVGLVPRLLEHVAHRALDNAVEEAGVLGLEPLRDEDHVALVLVVHHVRGPDPGERGARLRVVGHADRQGVADGRALERSGDDHRGRRLRRSPQPAPRGDHDGRTR